MSLAKSILFCGAMFLALSADASEVAIDWTEVGNPGNTADPVDGNSLVGGIQHLGAVPYTFFIDKFDVTVNQYVAFLNAKDPTGVNSLGLYSTNMNSSPFGTINYTAGNQSGSKYSAMAFQGSKPATYTNWYNSIRFANWLNNGQGNGDTETGAYTLGALGSDHIPFNPPLTHNSGAHVWLPTENEWYKAAYYNPATSSYFQYPTSSNTAPTSSPPTPTPNSANYLHAEIDNSGFSDVGAYNGTTSPYGAFDMGGNVSQWNEAQIFGSFRVFRGGSFGSHQASDLLSSSLSFAGPTNEIFFTGFRVASAIPEPSTFALAAFGFAGLAAWGWRRRKR